MPQNSETKVSRRCFLKRSVQVATAALTAEAIASPIGGAIELADKFFAFERASVPGRYSTFTSLKRNYEQYPSEQNRAIFKAWIGLNAAEYYAHLNGWNLTHTAIQRFLFGPYGKTLDIFEFYQNTIKNSALTLGLSGSSEYVSNTVNSALLLSIPDIMAPLKHNSQDRSNHVSLLSVNNGILLFSGVVVAAANSDVYYSMNKHTVCLSGNIQNQSKNRKTISVRNDKGQLSQREADFVDVIIDDPKLKVYDIYDWDGNRTDLGASKSVGDVAVALLNYFGVSSPKMYMIENFGPSFSISDADCYQLQESGHAAPFEMYGSFGLNGEMKVSVPVELLADNSSVN